MSGGDTDKDDKQFDASEQKLRRARESGDVPRSLELNAALVYLGWWGGLSLTGAIAVPAWITMARRMFGEEQWPIRGGSSALAAGRDLAAYAAFGVLALVAFMALCVLLGLVAQKSLTFTPSRLVPDFKRINPVVVAGQKFGKAGLVTFAISLGKVALVTVGGWYLFRGLLNRLLTSVELAEGQWLSGMGVIMSQLAYLALGTSVIFAAIDLFWKHFDYRRRNRMSRKEMLDEYKESEGDPYFKAARRQKGIDLVTQRMLDDVARADVVIVNPTHYAVALEWKRGSGRSPLCLAKGVDEIARRIRERAGENQIPIWSDPPSARALYATVEVGAEINPDHYKAVAVAIRFAEHLRKRMREGWGGSSTASTTPKPKSRKRRAAKAAAAKRPGAGTMNPPQASQTGSSARRGQGGPAATSDLNRAPKGRDDEKG